MRQETARLIRAAIENKPKKYPTISPIVKVKQGNQSRLLKSQAEAVRDSVLFTGGIGDFFAIESFMTTPQREGVKFVFLATRAAKAIKSIIEAAPIFPNLLNVTILHDDWSTVFCTFSLEHLKALSGMHKWHIDFSQIPPEVADYSIFYVFDEITKGRRHYNHSNIIAHPLADISKFSLPDRFTFLQPYSPNDSQGGKRDFSDAEWSATLRRLRSTDQKGVVVVNSSSHYVPNDPSIIDLSNRTTICEGIEIAKGCNEFIGVDSCFAAIVTKFLPNESITIKSVNEHYTNYLKVYCSPKTEFGFVCSDISKKW